MRSKRHCEARGSDADAPSRGLVADAAATDGVRLDQLIATAAPADAVTNQAFAWQDVLRKAGISGEIYAERIHADLSGSVRPLGRMHPQAGHGVLLRYSIWSAAAEWALKVERPRLGLIYHNITPAHFLFSGSPTVAALCERGRRELPRVADHATVAIADSAFNARELQGAGSPDAVVIPLLLDLAPPPPARESVPPSVLTVGRIAPSKRIEDVIRAVALLRRHLLPDAVCDIVGSAEGFEDYRRSLARFAARLGVDDAIRFRGRLSDVERDARYAESGAYLSMSAHEGFCAPVLEASSRGLAVVARGAGAVPETLGGGGLVLPDGDCALAAEALHAVLTDGHLRRWLRDAAAARIEEISPALLEARILEAVRPLILQ